MLLMQSVYKDIKIIMDTMVVKFDRIAKQYETLESITNADNYISAIQKTDRFDLYPEFDLEAIQNADIVNDLSTQMEYAATPSSIPVIYRDKVLESQRKYIIDNYVEINNYYRMLTGLPDIETDESDFISISQEDRQKYGIFDDLYIHQLSDKDIYKLEAAGIISKLISENPDKKYLAFLGDNKVDLVQARTANNFSILRVDGGKVSDSFYNTFVQTYNQNREYFMSVLYVRGFSDSYDLYDNFMGLSLMIMTIQRVLTTVFRFGIQRDFYDWEFVRNIYKSYNVPFVEYVPLEYQMILVKNLNRLLRYKSTDKVLFDLMSLLGYERVKIFQYYLVKEHRLDNNENPLFYYKKVTDAEGNETYVEDKERMYKLYFQAVNVKERNLSIAFQNKSNQIDYESVTVNDPYWWEDDNLMDSKYNDTYNYIETKYISLNVAYRMTEMLFEITYAFRMLLDKKDELNTFLVGIPKLYEESSFKIFDIVIFLVALLCKSHGFKDGTITTPSKIAHIYGFDFNDESINAIKAIIADNPKIIDPDINKYFDNLSVNSAEDANELFERIREYNTWIINKMRKSTNIEEYRMYKNIYTISMISDVQTEMFKIKYYDNNGNIIERPAETYLEYLTHNQPILADIITNMSSSDIPAAIEHVLAQIEAYMTNMQYTFLLSDSVSPIYRSLTTFVKFFKSYTVDLASFNIVYLFDSKYYQMIKLIDDIYHIDSYMVNKESLDYLYGDEADTMSSFVNNSDSELIYDVKKRLAKTLIHHENVIKKLNDKLHSVEKNMVVYDTTNQAYLDTIRQLTKLTNKEILNLIERCNSVSKISINDKFPYNNSDNVCMRDKLIITYD